MRFTTSTGEQVDGVVEENRWSTPEVGDNVRVEYSLRDPRYLVRDPDAAGSNVRRGTWLTVGLVLAAALTLMLARPMRRLRDGDRERTPHP